MYNESTNACSNVMDGSLPGKCASMVFPYVSMQSSNPKVYAQSEGLENGTLFPGLNLPFHKEIQSRLNCSNTALCELMALDFAVVELGLYLDTHKEDQEEGSRKMAKSHSAYQQARQAFHTKAFAGLQQGKQFGSPSGSLDYQVGDRVRHVKFGDGTVINIVEGGRDYEVTVDFDGPGTKKMFAAFARLQKI